MIGEIVIRYWRPLHPSATAFGPAWYCAEPTQVLSLDSPAQACEAHPDGAHPQCSSGALYLRLWLGWAQNEDLCASLWPPFGLPPYCGQHDCKGQGGTEAAMSKQGKGRGLPGILRSSSPGPITQPPQRWNLEALSLRTWGRVPSRGIRKDAF